MDVMTIGLALKGAQTAYKFVQKGLAAGKEIEDMGSTVSKWFECVNEIGQRDLENKNPPILKKLTAQKSIQAEAIQIVLAKKKALEMRKSLYDMLGRDLWGELVRTEREIKKRRDEQIYAARRLRQKIIDGACIFVGAVIVLSILFGSAYWLLSFHDPHERNVLALLI